MFEKLSPLGRLIIKTLAIAGCPLNRSYLRSILSHINARDPELIGEMDRSVEMITAIIIMELPLFTGDMRQDQPKLSVQKTIAVLKEMERTGELDAWLAVAPEAIIKYQKNAEAAFQAQLFQAIANDDPKQLGTLIEKRISGLFELHELSSTLDYLNKIPGIYTQLSKLDPLLCPHFFCNSLMTANLIPAHAEKLCVAVKSAIERKPNGESVPDLAAAVTVHRIYQGEFSTLKSHIPDKIHPWLAQLADALRDFFTGALSDDQIAEAFDQAIANWKKATGIRRFVCVSPIWFFYSLFVVIHQRQERYNELGTLCNTDSHKRTKFIGWPMGELFTDMERIGSKYFRLYDAKSYKKWTAPLRVLKYISAYYAFPEEAKKEFTEDHAALLRETIGELYRSDYQWLSQQANELYTKLTGHEAPMPVKTSTPSLSNLHKEKALWELQLEKMALILQEQLQKPQETKRLAWLISHRAGRINLTPVEQSLKNDGWSKGRKVSLSRLKSLEYGYLNDLDRRAAECIDCDYYRGREEWLINDHAALPLLAGHPALFNAESTPYQPINLISRELALQITPDADGIIELTRPEGEYFDRFILDMDRDNTWYVYPVRPDQHQLMKLFDSGIELPASAAPRLQPLLTGLSKLVAIHDESSQTQVATASELMHNQPLILQLYPFGGGLRVELLSGPFGDERMTLPPGDGAERLLTKLNGQPTAYQRDLNRETGDRDRLPMLCPALEDYQESPHEWQVSHLEDILEVVDSLRELTAHYTITWPKGQPYRLHPVTADFENLKLRIRRKNQWFEMDGELKLDDDLQWKMIDLLAGNKKEGRFIKLDDGRFAALSQQLYQELEFATDRLRAEDDSLVMHPMHTEDLMELADRTNLKRSQTFKQAIKTSRLIRERAYTIHPQFQAELRPYQAEGFQWLSRLADWGFGACLADDMGLGKTVQTLAFLQNYLNEGPGLIVAPASVCENWRRETLHFAPTLRPVVLNDCTDRSTILEELEPNHLLICSYGLLQREELLLTDIQWQAVVLDEAQMIKNRTAKRSKTARKLQAGFKLALSGTPIENQLMELWSLFEFINPGLLPTERRFYDHFVQQIERYDNRRVRDHLQKLIGPFLLRRRKSEVLTELPPKTEITLQIPLDQEELTFYETLRQRSISSLKHMDQNSPKSMQVLAALMRLRRAACHPGLVAPEGNWTGSKLNQMLELVEEMRENNHQLLIFSQFTDFLRLAQNKLSTAGIKTFYLDGSTPVNTRMDLVDHFQRGEADAFLISLKAGGTGLNLTAADYVIHLDPWWNPAVEDQASDRAHRMGRTKPVTVYRLVAERTVEEKILELHEKKRELAENLLADSDNPQRMDLDALQRLLEPTY